MLTAGGGRDGERRGVRRKKWSDAKKRCVDLIVEDNQ